MQAIRDADGNVRILQTMGEADFTIAHLAIYVMKCPVLSNDSDFLIYPVDWIDLKTLDPRGSQDQPLRCKRLDRQKFLAHFGLTEDRAKFLLPLAAALLGNDYSSGAELNVLSDRIFSQVKCLIFLVEFQSSESQFQIKQRKSKTVSPRHRKTEAILGWLGREGKYTEDPTLDSCLERLLNAVPADDRAKAVKLLMTAVSAYQFPCEDNQDTVQHSESCQMHSPVTGINCQFMDKYSRAELPSWCLDVLRLQLVFFDCQVEDANEPCSLDLALPILEPVIQLLLKMRTYEGTERPTQVEFVRRVGKRALRKASIQSDCDLHELPSRSSSELERKKFICQVLKSDFDEKCKYPLLQYCAVFWMKTCNVTRTEAAALLLAATKPEVIIEERKRIPTRNRKFEVEIVHSFAVFQRILDLANVLNKLLDEPFTSVTCFCQWTCSGMYRAVVEYRSAQELFDAHQGDCDDAIVLLKAIENNLDKLSVEKRHTSNAKTKRKSASKVKCDSGLPNELKAETDIDEDHQQGYFDFENKFALLEIAE